MRQLDQRINLKLGDSEATIHFIEISDDKKWLRSYIDMTLPVESGDEVLRSVQKDVLVEELYKLCEYFERHLSAHEAGSKGKMTMFTPSERLFRIFASTGSLDSDTKGMFPLRLMVNIGPASVNRNYVYRSTDALVQVSDIRDFITSTREFLLKVTG